MARIVALDIGGTKIASALVTLEPNQAPLVEHEAHIATQASLGGAQVLHNVCEAASRVLALAPETPDGIGISSAGVIDPIDGTVRYANDLMPGWGGTQLVHELEQRFGLAARALNDVHAHALGEARHGAGRGHESCLVCAVGTGVGGAFVEDGVLMLGAHNEAGHIGHVSCSAASGIACSCGATGHLEPIASGPGIIAHYIELGGDACLADGSPIDGAEIDRRARQGDQAACAAEARSGAALGEVLASLVNMLDPSCVIISGSVAKCGPAWHDALHKAWQDYVMPPVAQTELITGELAGQAPLIGAAEHCVRPAYRVLRAQQKER